MNNQVFTIEEMETIFEIGRMIQHMAENEQIEIEDSKEAFIFAVQLAVEFEEQYDEANGDYYYDIVLYIEEKILEKFGSDAE